MASLKDLRDRITSVKATQKITKAMQMVAAAKLRKAQEAVVAARPYTERMASMVASLTQDLAVDDLPIFLKENPIAKKYLIIVFTAERGLCGSFNSQIARTARDKIAELLNEGKEVSIITVGKKGNDILKREYGKLIIDHISLREINKISYKDGDSIAKNILDRFNNNEFESCLVIYSKFKSVIQQIPQIEQLIPMNIDKLTSARQDGKEVVAKPVGSFEYEPSAGSIIDAIAEHNISIQLFAALLENNAGEMGSKMTAMDNATRNAGDMINRLSITYNRQRQAKITTELIEIISGAEAL